ncbi:MAG TPA: GNAT family N-acetyltransferase [Anaerolineae bacterium]|nr:GNAT family N-acetyltransferase [Anaerolineae bacterium]
MNQRSYPETVTLRDGTAVTLRPIRPEDALRLQEAFEQLSPESVFLRFLDQRAALSDVEARRFATVDYHSSMAIVAVIEEHGEEHIIGSARYVAVDPAKPDTAEAAVTVVDEYQRRGLGVILVQHIVEYARAHGIRYFLATVHYSNEQILHFIERSKLRTDKRLESGAWEIKILLDAQT